MFISWKFVSSMILIFSIFIWFFLSLERSIFIWFFLEISVWGSFYFLLLEEREEKSRNSIRFFIIQGISSLTWILMCWSERFLGEILIPLIIFLKMGLIPGHFWVFKIYEARNLYIIWIISFFQKIIPLGIVFLSINSRYLSRLGVKVLLILNMRALVFFLIKEINFNGFLLTSRILHFNNIILLLVCERSLEAFLYFISYSYLLFVSLNFALSYGKSLSSPEGGSPKRGERTWIVGALSIVGFPPRLMFFIKIIFLINLRTILESYFLLVFVLIFLLYLLVLLSSSIRFVHLSSNITISSYSFFEGIKNFFNFPFWVNLLTVSLLLFLIILFSLLVLEKGKEIKL